MPKPLMTGGWARGREPSTALDVLRTWGPPETSAETEQQLLRLMGPAIKPMTHLVPSLPSLPCKEPGPQSCWGPWEHPEKMLLAASVPAVSVCLLTACALARWLRSGAAGSGKPYGWGGARECGPLTPTSIAVDGTPAHPGPVARLDQ